jgi:outer membrane protein W
MKKGKLIWLAVIAALVLVPTMGWAQAKMATPVTRAASEPSFFVEIYAGGGAALKQGDAFRQVNSPNLAIPISASAPGNIDPYFIPGLKIGYWFTPYGTYAISGMPDWMKYFGFYTDFSFHRLSFSNQTGSWRVGGANGTFFFDTNGNVASWAFMFAARYGFFPDSVVPFGRLQPYLAVGPAIFFSDQKPNVTIRPFNVGLSPAWKSSVNIGFAVETGARYFVNKSISVEASFKYRYFAPSYDFNGSLAGTNVLYHINSKPDFNLFSGQVGVAYHF